MSLDPDVEWFVHAFIGDQRLKFLSCLFQVVRVDQAEDSIWVMPSVRITQYPLRGWAAVQHLPLGIHHRDDVVGVLEQVSETTQVNHHLMLDTDVGEGHHEAADTVGVGHTRHPQHHNDAVTSTPTHQLTHHWFAGGSSP